MPELDDRELEERIRERFPWGAWERFPRRGGGYFRACALDVTEGPKVNEKGDCWDTYVPLDVLLSHMRDDVAMALLGDALDGQSPHA